MGICRSCGTQMENQEAFCPACGAVAENPPSPPDELRPFIPPRDTRLVAKAGYYQTDPLPGPVEEVMGFWTYVKALLLMSIPVAGLVFQFWWAFGKTGSLNRRNLARAFLLVSAIWFAVLSVYTLGRLIAIIMEAFFAIGHFIEFFG